VKLSAFLLGFLFIATVLNAQDSLRGPHEGVVKEIAPYKVELVECNDYFEVFIYTLNMDAIPNYGNEGDIKYFYESGTYKSFSLQYFGNDGFAAKVAEGEFVYCRVTVEVLGTLISVKFQNQFASLATQDK
jgi:hypothetical protein